MDRPPPLRRGFWLSAIVIFFLLGGALFLASLLPFDSLKPVVDHLVADNSLESFTHPFYRQLRPWMGATGLMLLAAGFSFVRFRQTSQKLLSSLLNQLITTSQTFRRDLAEFARSFYRLERDRRYRLALLAMLVIAITARLLLIGQPFRYDEAYTFIAFAMRPLRAAISDYHLPNNHVFHTALVHFAYQLFGPQPWAVRLPALLAGILMIPATYLVAALLFRLKIIALLSAAMITSTWVWIDYSTNARGYTLLAFFWLLCLALADYLRRNKNLAGWGFLALVIALGFYTIPTMLYPFGILVAWLFLSWLGGDSDHSYGKTFLLYLAGTCIIAAGLTLLLYLPVLRVSGLGAITANQYVRSSGWQVFLESIPGRINATWRLWNSGWPAGFGLLILSGVFLSLLLHKRIARHRIPLHLPFVLGLSGILVVQQIVAVPKVWLFLLPLFLVWAAAGWVGLVEALFRRAKNQQAGWWENAAILVAVGLGVLLAISALSNRAVERALDPEDRSISQDVALFLKEYLQEGDTVLAAVPINYPLKYYFVLYGVPPEVYYQEGRAADYRRLLAVVEPDSNRSLQYVLERHGLAELVDLPAAETIYRSGPTEVYALPLKPAQMPDG
ncbi:MAG TPA: glycosyltransferase family 39 protein [Anaerolineales bacterium]|nr:glycosyltransferase family 39 protein [Anaerolineales bacterium]